MKIEVAEGCQLILGQSHFIESVENIHECLVHSVPNIKFGLAFCESSGPCLVRHSGTDKELESLATEFAYSISAGHSFIIILKGAYPINVLNGIKDVPEVVNIFCATANPVEVIISESEEGRGILGVIDGLKSKGIENEDDVKQRKEFLRKIGYKF